MSLSVDERNWSRTDYGDGELQIDVCVNRSRANVFVLRV